MFKRRRPRSYSQIAQESIYPRGGWRRAGQYVLHRLKRLPDGPDRIGRGVAAGVFTSFTPFFGAHFVLAGLLGWLARGNVLAALIGTFVGNPLTFPFIAVASVDLGRRLLGMDGHLGPQLILTEVGRAMGEIAANLLTLTSSRPSHWQHLASVFEQVLWPYMLGGALLGLAAALAAHAATVPVIRAYQRRRVERLARSARRKG